MDVLAVLEKKITDLVIILKDLRTVNATLLEENKQLKEKIDSLETVILNQKNGLDEEKELTKLVVDSLIKNIDTIVEDEHQQ